jgi:hypothetical protein
MGLAIQRLMGTCGTRCLEDSVEVVVFGSMSVCLERKDSDLDLLCFRASSFKFKNRQIDLIGMHRDAQEGSLWLSSELASHVVAYGIWIKGSCTWAADVRVGDRAIETKRRRIAAFIKALPSAWHSLDETFRLKYSIKLRRETQRLILMEKGTPIPPTRALDEFWDDISGGPESVHNRVREFTTSSSGFFTRDLLARIDASFGTCKRGHTGTNTSFLRTNNVGQPPMCMVPTEINGGPASGDGKRDLLSDKREP